MTQFSAPVTPPVEGLAPPVALLTAETMSAAGSTALALLEATTPDLNLDNLVSLEDLDAKKAREEKERRQDDIIAWSDERGAIVEKQARMHSLEMKNIQFGIDRGYITEANLAEHTKAAADRVSAGVDDYIVTNGSSDPKYKRTQPFKKRVGADGSIVGDFDISKGRTDYTAWQYPKDGTHVVTRNPLKPKPDIFTKEPVHKKPRRKQ